MPNMLIVSRHFPPLASVGGSIRLVKFLKYNSEKGWRFTVLTQDLEKTVVPEEKLSASLLPEIPPSTQIVRVPAPFRGSIKESNFRLFNWVKEKSKKNIIRLLGDSSVAWGIRVFFVGLLNFKKWEIDLIYSITPPFTDALTGALLSVFRRRPSVLDLKDDWVGSPSFKKKHSLRQKMEIPLERMIIASTTAVVTVTPQSQQLYAKRYNWAKIFHVPNGCDLDEFTKLNGREKRIESQKFTILCAAWGFQKDYRDLTPFLTSLKIFLNHHPEARNKIDVILLGKSLSEEYRNLIIKLELQEIIDERETVNREDLVDQMWKADLFFLIQPVNNTTAISGTLYEYWAVGKAPILLISDKGASSSLVETNNIGKHFHFSQTEQCAEYIETLYDKYQLGNPIWICREGIEQYDRRFLASQMEIIWQDALSKDQV